MQARNFDEAERGKNCCWKARRGVSLSKVRTRFLKLKTQATQLEAGWESVIISTLYST